MTTIKTYTVVGSVWQSVPAAHLAEALEPVPSVLQAWLRDSAAPDDPAMRARLVDWLGGGR